MPNVKQLGVHGTQMTLEERSDVVLALAHVLFVNGQSTDQTMSAGESFARILGLKQSFWLDGENWSFKRKTRDSN